MPNTRGRPFNRARTNDEFLEELYEIRDDVEPLELYITRDTKMQFRCKKCNSIFTTTPARILKGRMCDKCRPRRIKEDLTGKRFNSLTVLGVDEEKQDFKKIFWKCQCDCGNIISTTGTHLKNNTSASCGCKRIQSCIEAIKKYNNYDLDGEYGIGYTTNTNEEFYFDKEDYDKIKNFAWRKLNSGYIATNYNGTNIYIHRLIMDCENDFVIDNKLDNRKQNLRICTRQENNYNRLPSDKNTSGCSGVQWDKRNNKWRSRISVNNKDIYLGLFDNFEDAVKSRKEAEIKYYKEFRYKGES